MGSNPTAGTIVVLLEHDLGRALLYLAVNGGDYRPAQHRTMPAVRELNQRVDQGVAGDGCLKMYNGGYRASPASVP